MFFYFQLKWSKCHNSTIYIVSCFLLLNTAFLMIIHDFSSSQSSLDALDMILHTCCFEVWSKLEVILSDQFHYAPPSQADHIKKS